jgi:hypothetical protein
MGSDVPYGQTKVLRIEAEISMRNWFLFSLTLLATACGGVNEEDFLDGYLGETCRILVDCADEDDFILFESQSDCVALMSLMGAGSIGDGCEYDKKIGQSCLNFLENQTCDSVDTLDDIPPECTGVYTGECQFTGEGEDTGGTDSGGNDTDTDPPE